MSFWKTLLTENDNQTFDIHRVLLLVGGLGYVALAAYQVIVKGSAFDYISYSAGFAGLLAGSGAGLMLKSKAS